MDPLSLPDELVLRVFEFVSLRDHLSCILVCKRYEARLSQALYGRLNPLRSEQQETLLSNEELGVSVVALLPPEAEKDVSEELNYQRKTRLGRKQVVQWACQGGSLPTLKKIDAVESLDPFINWIRFPIIKDIPKRQLQVTMMHLASLNGQIKVLKYLLSKGADVNASSAVGTSGCNDHLLPIHLAKSAEVIDILASHGSRMEPTTQGCTPLMTSLSWDGQASVVNAFTRLGVDPLAVSLDGTRAAKEAAFKGNVGALEALLDRGVDVKETFPSGEHLMIHAIRAADNNSECEDHEAPLQMVRLLLDQGADPNAGWRYTAQYDGAEHEIFVPYLLVAARGHDTANIFELLIERGAGADTQSTSPSGTIRRTHRKFDGLERPFAPTILANLVWDIINAPSPCTGEPLVSHDKIRKLEVLVQYGADIEAEVEGNTPLHYCLHQIKRRALNAMELVPHLLRLGADVNATNKDGSLPLHVLTSRFYCVVMRQWRQARVVHNIRLFHPSPLTTLMTGMIDKGADINAADAKGKTPLMNLMGQGLMVASSLLVKHLLEYPDLDLNVVDEEGHTALHNVLVNRDLAYTDEGCFRLQVLLSHNRGNLELNSRNQLGQTPLDLLIDGRDTRSNTGPEKLRRWSVKTRALVMLTRAGAHRGKVNE